MTSNDNIQSFLDGDTFAVAGASTNREKYGNKILRCYLQDGRRVFPINPRAEEIEGETCYPTIEAIPEPIHGLSIITPPKITLDVVQQALKANIRHIWMQPGAENEEAIELAESAGATVIHGGPCLLVVLGYRE